VGGGVGRVGRLGARGGSGVTFGGGVELGRLHVDYAYQGHDVVGGATHRFGVRWTP